MSIDYSEKIPNNVDLASDRKLQRALESWQPKFLDWWKNLGPSIPTHDVYLRTAVAVGRDGWAHFDRVPMEEYAMAKEPWFDAVHERVEAWVERTGWEPPAPVVPGD